MTALRFLLLLSVIGCATLPGAAELCDFARQIADACGDSTAAPCEAARRLAALCDMRGEPVAVASAEQALNRSLYDPPGVIGPGWSLCARSDRCGAAMPRSAALVALAWAEQERPGNGWYLKLQVPGS